MAPEELDKVARKVYIACVESGCINLPGEEYKLNVIKSAIRESEERGAQVEREACAKLAEEKYSDAPWHMYYKLAAECIADDIRERQPQENK